MEKEVFLVHSPSINPSIHPSWYEMGKKGVKNADG